MKTHCELLKEMLETRDYVKISDMRNWCNWRSRIADCRVKYGMDIRPILVAGADGRRNIHAYKLIRPLPTPSVKQDELFKVESHDGVVKFS